MKRNLTVRVTPETRQLADLAAEHVGAESTSEWVRAIVHRTAIRTLEGTHEDRTESEDGWMPASRTRTDRPLAERA